MSYLGCRKIGLVKNPINRAVITVALPPFRSLQNIDGDAYANFFVYPQFDSFPEYGILL